MPTDATAFAEGGWAQGLAAKGLAAPAASVTRRPFAYRRLLHAAFFVFMACGAVAFVEPSPFDAMALLVMPLWFVGGFRIHRAFVPFCALLSCVTLGGFLSLTPWWTDADAVSFMITSLYLMVLAWFFALFFAEHTHERVELCLKGFTLANLIAASAGIAGYLNIAGTAEVFSRYGRASGTFKDPNVLGGFLIVGALYCLNVLMLGRTRHRAATAAVFTVIMVGLLFTFSRGSYGAFALSAAFMMGSAFFSSRDRALRRRIGVGAIVAIGLIAIVLAGLLSFEEIRTFMLARTSGEGYDDPRYFNQARALPYLLEHPLGYGPLRFRLVFGIEPHSSYVAAFAYYGWFGGIAFLLLAGSTIFVGMRLCLAASPFRLAAQVVFPPLLAFLLQGFQIDIDHWRHFYVLLGAVWGLEAARMRWLALQPRPTQAGEAQRLTQAAYPATYDASGTDANRAR